MADIFSRVIEIQRDLHAHPELGFDTVRTAGIVSDVLSEAGLAVRGGVGKTGVVGDLDVDGATTRLAFRADMDALPMDEENDLPHKSTIPGRAHMCGHDAHTAMLLGAALALAERKKELDVNVRFIFQPNEEVLPGGAPAMIDDGCLEGVDRIFGMHMWPQIETGRIGILAGHAMGRPDTWRIVLRGRGGHAATPHETIDPIVGGAQLVTALQSVVARNIDPLAAGVLSVTQFHAGSADNVIPAAVTLGGTIRAFDDAVADTIRARMETITTQVAAAFGLEAEIDVTVGYPVVVNDAASCDLAVERLASVAEIDRSPDPVLGGEDFAYYLKHVPGAFLFLGNRNEAAGIVHHCHHPKFMVDDEAMRLGLRGWQALAGLSA